MTTIVRAQMAASTGALAAERERLEREISELSTGLPAGAAEIVRRADEIMAEHGERLADLKRRRDEIDKAFAVTAREAEAARERAAAEAHDALEAQFNGAAEAYLAGMGKAEEHLSDFVAHVNEAIAAHTEMRHLASKLAAGRKIQMAALNPRDMITRLGGRIAGMLRKIKLPDQGATIRIGPLHLPEEPQSPRMPRPGETPVVLGWREREREAFR
jgi:hypothetical protein